MQYAAGTVLAARLPASLTQLVRMPALHCKARSQTSRNAAERMCSLGHLNRLHQTSKGIMDHVASKICEWSYQKILTQGCSCCSSA